MSLQIRDPPFRESFFPSYVFHGIFGFVLVDPRVTKPFVDPGRLLSDPGFFLTPTPFSFFFSPRFPFPRYMLLQMCLPSFLGSRTEVHAADLLAMAYAVKTAKRPKLTEEEERAKATRKRRPKEQVRGLNIQDTDVGRILRE